MADTSHNIKIREHKTEQEGYIIPSHYVSNSSYQLIDIMQTQLTKTAYIGWSKGIILKYLVRVDEENKLRVVNKARYYLDELINYLSDTEKSSSKHIKPSYYKNTKLGIETIDVIKDQLPAEEYEGFLQGMVVRYVCRSSYKEHLYDDLLKAKYYLDRLFNHLEEKNNVNKSEEK